MSAMVVLGGAGVGANVWSRYSDAGGAFTGAGDEHIDWHYVAVLLLVRFVGWFKYERRRTEKEVRSLCRWYNSRHMTAQHCTVVNGVATTEFIEHVPPNSVNVPYTVLSNLLHRT